MWLCVTRGSADLTKLTKINIATPNLDSNVFLFPLTLKRASSKHQIMIKNKILINAKYNFFSIPRTLHNWYIYGTIQNAKIGVFLPTLHYSSSLLPVKTWNDENDSGRFSSLPEFLLLGKTLHYGAHISELIFSLMKTSLWKTSFHSSIPFKNVFFFQLWISNFGIYFPFRNINSKTYS